jgi:hypothetical protein
MEGQTELSVGDVDVGVSTWRRLPPPFRTELRAYLMCGANYREPVCLKFPRDKGHRGHLHLQLTTHLARESSSSIGH